MNFEQYLNDFNSTINIWQFLINVLVVTIIAYLVKLFYINFGRAISNREKFSNNFIPLALSTLLIITVIKSSVALSLGLVGALSIVRFRAAIKDPEELTFLFLIIGLGLIGGANKPILAIVSFAIFLPILYLNNKLNHKKKILKAHASMHVKSKLSSVQELSNLISSHAQYLELKRADFSDNNLHASYQCVFNEASSLDTVIMAIKEKDHSAEVTYVDQPDLLL